MLLPVAGKNRRHRHHRRLQVVPEGMPLEIDWSHHLAHGLAFLALPGHPDPRNLVTGDLPQVVGPAVSWASSPYGVTAKTADAASGLAWPFPRRLEGTVEVTVVL